MTPVFSIPELVGIITSNFNTEADVSSFSQCCRVLYTTATPSLYRNIEFSIFKVDSLEEALRRNPSFSKYCRSISITSKGIPQSRQASAYYLQYDSAITGMIPDNEPVLSTRKEVLSSLLCVLDQCSVHGNIIHFSWFLQVGNVTSLVHSFDWLTKVFKDWRSFITLSRKLKSLHYSSTGINTSFGDMV